MKELSLHILDIARNSYEAGASNVYLDIKESPSENIVRFSVKDDGRGMDEETLKKAVDPFYTTRTTRKVGLGLSLLKANAQICGGGFSIDSEAGVGTRLEASFAYDNIDRPPMGDLAQSIFTLLMTDVKVNLVFSYAFEDKDFSFSMNEIREILGDDSAFDDMEVIMWLRGFLKENISSTKE